MGCIQSKDKGYSIPDLQCNEINNPMKESSFDRLSTPDKPLSPKELMLQRSGGTPSNAGEENALLGSPPSSTPPPSSQHKVLTPTPDALALALDTTEEEDAASLASPSPAKTPSKSPKKSPKQENTKKLSVSEVLMQEKMKKKNNGKSSSENEVRTAVLFCKYIIMDAVSLSFVLKHAALLYLWCMSHSSLHIYMFACHSHSGEGGVGVSPKRRLSQPRHGRRIYKSKPNQSIQWC
jgi:hypothetical protein